MKTKSFPSLCHGLLALGLVLLWPAALHAAPITPVAWKYSNAFSANRTADKLSNANGFDPTGTLLFNQDVNGGVNPTETTSADGKYWMTSSAPSVAGATTAASEGRVWVVFDLGAVYDLSTIKIWNINWDNTAGSPTTSLNNRGVSQLDVLVRNSVADTTDGTIGGTAVNNSNAGFNDTLADDAVFNLGSSNPWTEVLANQALAQAANDDAHAATSYNLTGQTGRFVAIRVDSYYLGAGMGLGKVRIEGTLPPPTGGWAINGGGSFNLNTNWLDNTVPTANAIFGDVLTAPNAPALVTLDSPVSLTQVKFLNANTYALAGPSTLTLTGGATLNATLGTHSITAPVTGSAGVTKTGPGTVILTNASNSYTGNTTVTEGVLAATHLDAINQASGVIDIAADMTFALAGDGAGNGANGTLTEVVQGAGNLVVARSLITEVITLGSANPGLTGQVQINGGRLKPGNVGALGDTAGTTLVTGGDDFDTSALWLDGITITGETLGLNARKEIAAAAPHLVSTGTSGWAGPIQGNTGGPNYNIQSQSGLLTLSGSIDAPNGTIATDPAIPVNGDRIYNFTGDGDTRIEGPITDVTGSGDGGNIALTKVGAGTLTIATIPTITAGEGYHQGRTVIDGGKLAVQESGVNEGELFSRTIEVASGATFEISSFTEYELQLIESGLGQILSGAGTVDLGGTGRKLILFPDSTISPGDTAATNVPNGTDATGTLTINGDVSTNSGATFQMEIAGNGTNDTVSISGTAVLTATINVTGLPTVPITNGTVFTLISAAGGITNTGITFGPLPSPNLTTNITPTAVQLIWNDPNAPTVVTYSPNAVTEVPVTTDLVATFNERVLLGTTGDILIRNVTNNTIVQTIPITDNNQVTLSASGLVLTINPAVDLVANQQYAVQIANTAITDISGNPYAGIADDTTWAFATDSIGPLAQSLSPAGVTNATRNTRLLLQLNEAFQLGAGTFTVHKASDNTVVETIDVSTPGAVAVNGNKVAVVRSVTLAPSTAYYVNASAGVFLDSGGNLSPAITGTTAWAFTTSALQAIVVEDFTNSNGPLSGTGADTFAFGITSAGGSPTWVADDDYLQNGVVNGVGAGTAAYLNLGSYINAAKGTAAGKFTLVMTLSETNANWISLGFAAENAPNILKNFTNVGTGSALTTGVGTIIYRAQNSATEAGGFDMWGGNTTTGNVDGPDGNTGFRRLTVQLDLTPAGGYNGTSNYGTVTWSDGITPGTLGSVTYTTARNFGSILISQASSSSGTINALALYQEGLPVNTYSTWINSFAFAGFVSPDLTATGDPDNDGLDNALENLFGTSPEVFSQGLTAVSTSGGNLVFRHPLSTTPASDLTGAYEWSTDLATWRAFGASAGATTVTFSAPVIITPGTPALVEVTATVTGTPVATVFARFKATQD